MTREKATVLAKKFLEWVTDENGEPKEELINHIYEDIDLVPGYSVFIYVDYEEEGSLELDDYWRGICTYVELWRGDSMVPGAMSSCYGCAEYDIATEICIVCGRM